MTRIRTLLTCGALALLAACGGSDEGQTIRTLVADFIDVDAPPAGDPVVYLEHVSTDGEMVTVNIKLRSAAPLQFSTFTLEIHALDPTTMQLRPGTVIIAPVGYAGTVLCACDSANICLTQPATNCFSNDAGTGEFVFGASVLAGELPFDSSQATPDANNAVTLMTLGFIARTETPGTRLEIIDGSGVGDCEILQDSGGGLVDVPVECDGGGTLTASRQ